jgi:GDP/UDP-N,N'-diacetylbacillosamine 2-epimerase (hydrolysing)
LRSFSQRHRGAAKPRIAFVTGTRAEFGLIEPILRAIEKDRRLDAPLIVTGMHLLPRFGQTIDQIREDGWHVDGTVRMQTGKGDVRDEPRALARGIEGIARLLQRLKCDAVLVLGDRIEAFAGACAAAVGRRVLIHVHGGDRAVGDMDDVYRDAISRLAHIHLAASRDAVSRLRRMGEPVSRIHLVGAPGLDDIGAFRAAARRSGDREKTLLHRLIGPLAETSYAVVIQHPVGRSDEAEAASMRRILTAVERQGLAGVIIYPNSDPGHAGVVRMIQQWSRRPGWRAFRSLPRLDYLRLAMRARLLVGNSSSGIIESASLGVLAVNIGPRQAGRLRCGPGVIDAADNPREIDTAIGQALRRHRPDSSRSVYGDGRAGQRIVDLLSRLLTSPDWAELRGKRFAY